MASPARFRRETRVSAIDEKEVASA